MVNKRAAAGSQELDCLVDALVDVLAGKRTDAVDHLEFIQGRVEPSSIAHRQFP